VTVCPASAVKIRSMSSTGSFLDLLRAQVKPLEVV
jgi:hypothetical protein